MTLDLKATLTTTEAVARKAGDLLREAVARPRQIEFKGVINLVTETDRASEALIVAELRDVFPDHAIIGEEGTNIGAAHGSDYRWHIDPLDGTTNFAHGLPHFSVSIALAGPDGLPLLGVVYDPLLDECFTAIQGGGAFLNRRPIHVSSVAELSGAMLATGFP